MNPDTKTLFSLELQVRDYECDLQGVVNNAVYLHYLEHSRHEFLKTIDLDFARLHREGIDAMVSRIEIDYRYPLKGGDRFLSTLALRENGALRLEFHQELLLLPDRRPVVSAVTTTVCIELSSGRPIPIRRVFGALSALTGGLERA